MARHAHSKQTDRALLSAVLIAVIAPVAAFIATDNQLEQLAAAGDASPAVENAAANTWQVVPVATPGIPPAPSVVQSPPPGAAPVRDAPAADRGASGRISAAAPDVPAAAPDVPAAAPDVPAAAPPPAGPPPAGPPPPGEPPQILAASAWRVAAVPPNMSDLLPVGDCPEQGLQVRTIRIARVISAMFPEIVDMSGVRPDSKPWHPNGLAIDIMIPNPGSDAGIALGDAIVAFVLQNAGKYGIQDAIWRDTYYTPSGPSGSGYGHYDHVHVTTTGGGYPTGGEVYSR